MHRLKTRPQFQAVLAAGTIARTTHFALHCLRLEAAPTPRLTPGAAPLFTFGQRYVGALVPKRWARRAVTRNAVRRQIYSLAQRFAADLPSAAYVVRLRTTFDRATFVSAASVALKRAVRVELEQLFARALERVAKP